MSADRQTLLYHLVSSGTPHWIAAEDDAPIPADHLLSFELEIYQGLSIWPRIAALETSRQKGRANGYTSC
jgi:hypothetical protein